MQDTTRYPPDGAEPKIPALFKEERSLGPQLELGPNCLQRQVHHGSPALPLSEHPHPSTCFNPIVLPTQPPSYPAQPFPPIGHSSEGAHFHRSQQPLSLPQSSLPLHLGGPPGDMPVLQDGPALYSMILSSFATYRCLYQDLQFVCICSQLEVSITSTRLRPA